MPQPKTSRTSTKPRPAVTSPPRPKAGSSRSTARSRRGCAEAPDDLLGKSIHDILSVGGRIAVETHLAPLLRMQGYVNEIALDLLAADGEKIPTIANAAEKRDEDGRHLFTRLDLVQGGRPAEL